MTTATPSAADTLRDLIRRGDELIERQKELATCNPADDVEALLRGDEEALRRRREYIKLLTDLARLSVDQLTFIMSLDPASIRFLSTP
jgi:hypothetical protein